jgi:hypothetical protein
MAEKKPRIVHFHVGRTYLDPLMFSSFYNRDHFALS